MKEISDGHHTMDELYYHRMVLFSTICVSFHEKAWKAKKHHDGTMFDDYFIVGIDTPAGQYSYHYHERYWGHFAEIRELPFAPEWDGHKPEDVTRLYSLIQDASDEIRQRREEEIRAIINEEFGIQREEKVPPYIEYKVQAMCRIAKKDKDK